MLVWVLTAYMSIHMGNGFMPVVIPGIATEEECMRLGKEMAPGSFIVPGPKCRSYLAGARH